MTIYHVKSPANHHTNYYYFSGYFTLFTFRNPVAGSKLRICQALILPHLQGKGLGREMLLAVYRLAEERDDVAEITVEDPAVTFQRLRDKVDFQWAKIKVDSSLNDVLNHSTKEFISNISKSCKFCHSQSVFVSEAIKLYTIINNIKHAEGRNAIVDEEKLNELEDFRRFRQGKFIFVCIFTSPTVL